MILKSKIILCIYLFIFLFIILSCSTPKEIVKTDRVIIKAQYLSAGPTGCFPSEIEINFIDPKWNIPAVWTAKCKSKVYVCSSHGAEDSMVNCSPQAQ